jgi:hypothetical protein
VGDHLNAQYGLISTANQSKEIIFFSLLFWRSLYPMPIYRSKLGFTLFKGCTSSKVQAIILLLVEMS